MTYQEIKAIIESIGLPSTYYQFNEGDEIPSLPYVVWYFPSSDNFSADNIVWQNNEQLNVELYSANKDFATEKAVETVLNNNGLFWEKTESYISSENMYEVLYILHVAINERG